MNANELADELNIVEDKADAHALGHIKSTVAEAATMLRQQAEELKRTREYCVQWQNAAIDLAKKNAFLEDWKKTWLPYIKEAHGINTTILRGLE